MLKLVPSGLVNSLKVGSEMAVWEMERMGFRTQEMSLGWQDFTHRMISARSTLDLLEERSVQPSQQAPIRTRADLYSQLHTRLFLDQTSRLPKEYMLMMWDWVSLCLHRLQ